MEQVNTLVVDDNPQNSMVLALMLSRQGATCTEVRNSLDLPTLLPTLGPIDAVFLDLEMPGIDGYKAKDLIRSKLGQVPIIAYTVHVSEITFVRNRGFDGFLSKPLDTDDFPEQFARIMRHEPVWDRR